MSRRFQFNLKALLWLTLCIACFFAGAAWERHFRQPVISQGVGEGTVDSSTDIERLKMPDGTIWFRAVYHGNPAGALTFYSEQGEKITFKAPPPAKR